MLEARLTARSAAMSGVGAMMGTALVLAAGPVRAADPMQPPPYEVAGASGVGISVVWDADAIRKALPPGIEPAKGMTGGINIYAAERGYVIAPYSAAYFYVDVEGFDTPEGAKGRWMLAGVYGPQSRTVDALKASGFPVRSGTSRSEPTADGKRVAGTVNGKDFVSAEIKSVPGSCQPAAALLHYLTLSPDSERVVVTKIPVTLDACKAELVSAKVTARRAMRSLRFR
jgi:hypothetical protein